jgi:uncharacterized membrane protein
MWQEIMELLSLGLLVFFGIHLLPTLTDVRTRLIAWLGYVLYLALFSAISLLAFSLIIVGYGQAGDSILWSAPTFARPLAAAIMPFAFILLVAAYVPSLIRAKLKHPMLIGTIIWAAVHLLANGDVVSTLLFGGFLAYAIASIYWSKPHSSLIPKGQAALKFDLLAIIAGLLAYGAVLNVHY